MVATYYLFYPPKWLDEWLSVNNNHDSFRFIGLYFAGVVIAPLGFILASIRTKISERQLINEKRRRIGEEFTSSVELLGHKTAAVRQGGIYALGALANEEKEKYGTIIKIVASYIRETKKETETDEPVIAPDGIDIEAALSVIKSRNDLLDIKSDKEGEYVFDLSNACIRNGDLSNTVLSKINMSDFIAKDCVFKGTKFINTNMVAAQFSKCDFTESDFSNAQLSKAKFMEKSCKEKCNFQGAILTGAELDDAELYDADLSGVIGLTQNQIDEAKGNKETILPPGIRHPKHW